MPAGAYDLAAFGYEEQEFLLEGVARSYELAGERTGDGCWTVKPGLEAPFVTRFVIRRPTNQARFSGSAVLEWHNVSAGLDVGPDWSLLHRDLMARGHVWVGVSAQKAGIDGGGLVEGLHLKKAAPDRYAGLVHPGDAWSYDIFTQTGEILRPAAGPSPLGELAPARLTAMGESQSAAFLVTYINGIDPEARVFDGFFVHGRPGSGAALDGFRAPGRADAEAASRSLADRPERIRDDARVPVLVLQSETDVVLLGGGLPAQPDGVHLRQWEVAGAAHADTYILSGSYQDDGHLDPERLADLLRPTTEIFVGTTDIPINSGPQQHYVGQAAFESLDRWVAGGGPPPSASRLDVTEDGRGFHLDENGNATGGVRTPWVDVPTATLSGLGQRGEVFAVLFGTTKPFDSVALAARYPGGRDQYMQRFSASLDSTIAAGFILPEDRAEIVALAEASYPLSTG